MTDAWLSIEAAGGAFVAGRVSGARHAELRSNLAPGV